MNEEREVPLRALTSSWRGTLSKELTGAPKLFLRVCPTPSHQTEAPKPVTSAPGTATPASDEPKGPRETLPLQTAAKTENPHLLPSLLPLHRPVFKWPSWTLQRRPEF